MDLLDILKKRKSIRKYTDEAIPEETIEKILEAAKLAPSGRNKKPVKLIVVRDKETLEYLSNTRSHGSQLLAGANAAIVVTGDSELSDTWIEDCSIAMTIMQLRATELGIGNCWVQVRGRTLDETGEVTADLIKNKLNIEEKYSVECMLALGMPAEDWRE
ncbi:MAG: nitroreductase family protein [Eubacterium sp.]|nr:nitroreductase family protein [Eubacterium sp.]